MRKRTYTDQELREAVASNTSWRQVLASLGLVQGGGSQEYLIKLCKSMEISVEHFTGQRWSKGRTYPEKKKQTLNKYISNSNIKCNTDRLRRLLLETGTKPYKCEACGGTTWEGQPMPLELHHVDGKKTNNLLMNLQILCPNCHAQTPNHAGKANRRKDVL